MKHAFDRSMPLATIFALCLCLVAAAQQQGNSQGAESSSSSVPAQNKADLRQQRKSAEKQARPEVEQQRRQAEQEAEKSLNRDAITAIEETRKAISAIASKKNNEALAAIERATGKVNVLLARNPATALIPVESEVEVIDVAPQTISIIRDIARDAEKAVDDRDFPRARALLYNLTSELRVRTYNLPLATYPTALQEAARLLDQMKTREASSTLLTALNTLAIVERVTPLPLLVARAAINQAEQQRQKDKNTAQTLLQTAKNELQRSKELGYGGNDPVYAALDDQISNLEKQLNSGGETASFFTTLKDRLAGFLKREAERDRAIVESLTARKNNPGQK